MSIASPPDRVSRRPNLTEQRTVHDEVKIPQMPVHLRQILKKYREPSVWRSSWQIVNTLVPYAGAWALTWYLYEISYWAAVAGSLLIASFMIRLFVLHHDCTHGSFFKTRRANEFWGLLLGALVITPFHRWRRSHNYHHAHSGDLDHRGEGYIGLYTVREYQAISASQKFWYRVYRHPLTMLVVGPWVQFMILERFTFDLPKNAHTARWGVYKTNAILAGILVGVFLLGGWPALGKFTAIFLPTSLFSTFMGVWLFFVQHNYDRGYFKHHDTWNFADAALDGCSFYDLPAIMHWFSASIGYHHIHHLDSTIPNYNLARCHRENPEFQTPYTITLWQSRKCLWLDLWDEDRQRLVPFSAAAEKVTSEEDEAQAA